MNGQGTDGCHLVVAVSARGGDTAQVTKALMGAIWWWRRQTEEWIVRGGSQDGTPSCWWWCIR